MEENQVMTNTLKISIFLFLMVRSIGFSQQKQDSLANRISKISTATTAEKSTKSSIPVETMFGNRKVNYLSILNNKLGNSKKLSYFSVITIAAPYDKTNGPNELIVSNALTYKLSKKLFATGGLQYHFLKGVVPASGFQFFPANAKWLFVLSSSIAFALNTSFQNVGIMEFKPCISNILKLYTRVQGIYNIKLKNNLHERSLLYLRTGLTIKRTSLGLGFNMDFYGPDKTKQENFGIFIHQLL
ncbi:hypothetical protein MTsPCn9_09880 [Croceitalea sp. MTPC9]|uniref:Outer membrane protein beta-barrel domain-containing protein n=1 Tax=Croceitalea marina TaxID=1775166 RepID=A0ABW5N0Z8_9FLAO|nr:hypothetical protein MTsPCn6_27360 [Croceitalea sp. MTPC6]GMN16052.1 hypothetical protein MTsPCn9_09880 [Croceitalea sp. MTPC9]